jgi:hypothetical protein
MVNPILTQFGREMIHQDFRSPVAQLSFEGGKDPLRGMGVDDYIKYGVWDLGAPVNIVAQIAADGTDGTPPPVFPVGPLV